MEHTFEFGQIIDEDNKIIDGIVGLKLTTDDDGKVTTDELSLTHTELVDMRRALDDFIFDLLLK